MTLTMMTAEVQSRFGQIVRQDRGATATEYGLLVAFIAIVIIVGVSLFGTALNTFFTNLATSVGLF
jgi:pilus assembly protein Flp/PilA